MIGIETQEWLGSVTQVMPSLIILDVWQWTPMIALITIAGIATIPADPYESASVDGANIWQRFRHITLPLLMPTVITAVTLRMIDLVKTFDTIYATTQGGPNFASQTLNLMIFDTAFSRFQFGYASALLMVFFIILIVIVLLLMALRKRLGGIE
jgi:multiple sugar transport system permease protein